MYLVVKYSDGSSGVVDKISDENRLMVNDGDGNVYRMNELKFQNLVVDVEDAEEDDEDAIEVDGGFYNIGEDKWADVPNL